ncbi:hypothetical protein HY992_03670 [Candidatus Micrarchaeota archaeon]|nr:hypothetical protein [Candidatus Micrarchaeota archaeon]
MNNAEKNEVKEFNEVKAAGSRDFNKAVKGKFNVLASENNEVLKQGLKRFEALYNPTYAFDIDLLQKTAINEKKMLVKVSDLVHTRGMTRARLLSKMIFFMRLCLKYKARVLIASGAKNEFEEKNKNELETIGIILGMKWVEAKKAVGGS